MSGIPAPVRGADAIPKVKGVDGGIPNVMAPTIDLGAAFGQIASRFFASAENDRIGEAMEAGKKAGAGMATTPDGVPLVELRKGNSKEAQAFNRFALDGYQSRMQLATMQQMESLEKRFATDPAALREAVNAWRDGARAAIPTEMQSAFDLMVERHALPSIKQAEGLRQKQMTAAMDADFEAWGMAAEARIQGAYRKGYAGAGNPVAVSADGKTVVTDTALASMNEVGTLYQGAVSRVMAYVDKGMLQPAQAVAAVQAFQAKMVERAAMGAFEGASNKTAFYRDFITGKMKLTVPLVGTDGKVQMQHVNARDVMGLEAGSRLQKFMGTVVDELDQVHERGRRDAERAASAKLTADVVAAKLSGDEKALERALKNPFLKPEQIDTIINSVSQGYSNPFYLRQTEQDIMTGRITDPGQLSMSALSRPEYARLTEMVQKRQAFSREVRFQDAEGLLQRDIGGIAAGAGTILGPQAADQARQELVAGEQALIFREADRALAGGFVIGRTGNGKAYEITRGAEGTERKVFDPVAFANERIINLRGGVGAATTAIRDAEGRAQEADRAVAAARAQGKSAKEIEQLRAQSNKAWQELNAARAQLRRFGSQGAGPGEFSTR